MNEEQTINAQQEFAYCTTTRARRNDYQEQTNVMFCQQQFRRRRKLFLGNEVRQIYLYRGYTSEFTYIDVPEACNRVRDLRRLISTLYKIPITLLYLLRSNNNSIRNSSNDNRSSDQRQNLLLSRTTSDNNYSMPSLSDNDFDKSSNSSGGDASCCCNSHAGCGTKTTTIIPAKSNDIIIASSKQLTITNSVSQSTTDYVSSTTNYIDDLGSTRDLNEDDLNNGDSNITDLNDIEDDELDGEIFLSSEYDEEEIMLITGADDYVLKRNARHYFCGYQDVIEYASGYESCRRTRSCEHGDEYGQEDVVGAGMERNQAIVDKSNTNSSSSMSSVITSVSNCGLVTDISRGTMSHENDDVGYYYGDNLGGEQEEPAGFIRSSTYSSNYINSNINSYASCFYRYAIGTRNFDEGLTLREVDALGLDSCREWLFLDAHRNNVNIKALGLRNLFAGLAALHLWSMAAAIIEERTMLESGEINVNALYTGADFLDDHQALGEDFANMNTNADVRISLLDAALLAHREDIVKALLLSDFVSSSSASFADSNNIISAKSLLDVNEEKFFLRNTSSLILGVEAGNPEIVQLLLKNKADVNARTPDGDSALWTAAFRIQLQSTFGGSGNCSSNCSSNNSNSSNSNSSTSSNSNNTKSKCCKNTDILGILLASEDLDKEAALNLQNEVRSVGKVESYVSWSRKLRKRKKNILKQKTNPIRNNWYYHQRLATRWNLTYL